MAKKLKKKSNKKTTKKTKKKVVKKSVKKVAKKITKKTVKKAAKKKAPKKIVKKAKKVTKKKVVAKAISKASVLQSAPSETTAPEIGSVAPAETVEDVEGRSVNVQELAQTNRHLVLYFYPKDDTPGCTKEACDFRDNLALLTEKGAAVVGVSPDAKESHQNFISKYELNFNLLADTDQKLSKKLGVWKQKNFMGNSYMGVERSTFLYTDGKLAKVWQPVKVEGHVSEIISALEESN
jgi:peroxiredoxin Q/BCP